MITLSSTQAKIVKAPTDTAIQVLASAGTGKTRVLTERVRHIINNSKKDGVIALTFTNKAAEEMQERLRDLDVAEGRLWISTIHSVAQRILSQYGHTIGLPSDLHIYERDTDRMEVFLQSLRNDGVDIDEYLNVSDDQEKKNREKILSGYMDSFSLIKREMLTEDEVLARYPDASSIWSTFQDYQGALLESGGIDFDDILVNAHKLLLMQDWVADIYRTKFKHVCVDEAQDLNKVQYEFIKVLCGSTIRSIMMVGDPDQMIYGFNGSSSDYLCTNFVRDFKPESFELKENYRCTKKVIHAANKLKPSSQQESSFALEGAFFVKGFPDELQEASWIADEISRLIGFKHHDEIEGEISLNRMVVLGRNRFVFTKLVDVLQRRNIPFFLKKGERREEPSSFLGKILDYAIRIKLNPKDWVDGRKLCSILELKEPEDWGAKGLLTNWSQSLNSSAVPFPELQGSVLAAVDSIDISEPNIRKLTTPLMEKIKNLASCSTLDDGLVHELEISMKELEEFQECWTRFRKKGLGSTLQAFRNAMALGQLWEEDKNDGLLLSTIHTMKGLEKDIVILMGMCEGVFPDYRAKTRTKLAEEKNNMFVAVTRAKRWLYITYPNERMMPWGTSKAQRASRFIGDITE